MKKLEINMENFMRLAGNKKIIAYGAGSALYKALFEFQVVKEMYAYDWTNDLFIVKENKEKFIDIYSKIEFVVDSNIGKWGNHINILGNKLEIKSPESLFFLDYNKYILFIASTYSEDIVNSLEKIDVLSDLEYVITSQFFKEGYNKKTIGYYYQKVFRPVIQEYMCSINITEEININMVRKCIDVLNKIIKSNNVIIPSIGFKVTTKCTLKCKNCIDLVPYLKHRDIPVEIVLNDIGLILDNVSKIYFVHLVTGETLLYPYLDQILKKLVEKIGITTNGTTLPYNKNAIQYLQSPKVEVGVSDYGDIMGITRIVDFCEKNLIKVTVVEQQKWMDTGRYPEKRNKSAKDLKYEFDHCYLVQDCPKIIANGKLYACGKTEKFVDLGEYKDTHDYSDLTVYSGIELKKKIYEMYFCDYLESCDMCDTFSDAITGGNKNWVLAGKQKEGFKQIERSSFTLHKRDTL